MNVLITGNAGFIGKYLTKALIKHGHKVTGIDIRHDTSQVPESKHIIGDICNRDIMSHAVKGTDLIIHLAAKHHDFGVTREEFFNVNERGTKNILDVASNAGVKRLIFFSSVAVYGQNEADEDTHPSPSSDYGQSKLAAEKAIKQWWLQDKLRSAVIIRPTAVFGINNFENIYNLIDKVVRKKFFWVGDGQNIKSVAYIENIVDMTVFLLERMKPGFEVFNFSDEPLTTKQIVEKIAKFANIPPPRLKIPFFLAKIGGKIMDLAANLSGINFSITGARIEKFCTQTYFKSEKILKLGWRQPITLDEGFKKTIKWYLQQENKVKPSFSND